MNSDRGWTRQGAERELKRIAIQIAAQLPEGESDALAVLKYANELVTGYLRPGSSGPELRVLTGAALGRENADH